MNRSQLHHDLAADAIACAARRYRRTQIVRGSAVCLVLLGVVWWFQGASRSSTDSDSRLQVRHIQENEEVLEMIDEESVSLSRVCRIESDQELLVVLEEFGPIIAQFPDGSKRLILTREEEL